MTRAAQAARSPPRPVPRDAHCSTANSSASRAPRAAAGLAYATDSSQRKAGGARRALFYLARRRRRRGAPVRRPSAVRVIVVAVAVRAAALKLHVARGAGAARRFSSGLLMLGIRQARMI